MRRNGLILLLILICVAFLVSCSKKENTDIEKGELVRTEAEGFSLSLLHIVRLAVHVSIGSFFAGFSPFLRGILTLGQRLGIINSLRLFSGNYEKMEED